MTVIIGRRELLAALGGAAAWPLAARDAAERPVVGLASSSSAPKHLSVAARSDTHSNISYYGYYGWTRSTQ